MDQPDLIAESISVDAGPVALRARSWSGGSARPFLLVHGLSSNARLWDVVAGELAAAGHPVVAVDLRGHGASADVPDTDSEDPDAPPTDPTRTAAQDLDAVCVDLGWSAPVVAGHAWGANIALQLAADRPDLVHGLGLVDGGWMHLGDQWSNLDEAWGLLAPPRFDGIGTTTLRKSLRTGHPDWSAEAIEATLANLHEREDGDVTPWLERERHRAVLGSMLRHQPRTLYGQIHCPVVLLAAFSAAGPPRKRDQVAEALAGLAHAELVEFPGGDHDLHAQQPARVAQALEKLA